MTTKRGFEISLDVFSDNQVFNVRRESLGDDFSLSAALKLEAGRPLTVSQGAVLDEMFGVVRAHLPTYDVWIVVSNGGKVPGNRVVRHYGLWRALEKNSIPLPRGERTKEFVVESNEGVQFFGAIRVASPNFHEIVGLIERHSSTHILMSDKSKGILDLIEDGWSYGSRKFPAAMLSYVARYSMIIMAPLGEFDDVEGGAVALSTPPKIRECFAS